MRPIDNPDRVINKIYDDFFPLTVITFLINTTYEVNRFPIRFHLVRLTNSIKSALLIIDNIYHTIDTLNLTLINIRNSLDSDQF